ncbi:hypothetical protein B484DRAFT_286498, partial [Ochromonadaceae sp. CCMP2298]
MPYLATTRWAREHLEVRSAPSSDTNQARVLLLRWWDTHKPTATPTTQASIAQMLGAHGGVPPPRSTSSSATDTPSELADFVDSLGGQALMDRVYLDTTANDSAGGQNQSLSQNLGIPRSFNGSPFLGGNSQTFGSQVQRGTQHSQISARDWRSQGGLLSHELGGEGDFSFPDFGQEGDTSTPTDGSNPEVTALRREITALQNQITTQTAPNQSGYGTGLPLNLSGTAPNANRSGVERPGYASASFFTSSIIAMANLATPVQELGKQLHRLIDTCLALPLVNPFPGTLESSYAALFELKQHHLFTLNPGSLVILGMPLSGLASTISACPSGTVTYTEFLKGNLAVYRASNNISEFHWILEAPISLATRSPEYHWPERVVLPVLQRHMLTASAVLTAQYRQAKPQAPDHQAPAHPPSYGAAAHTSEYSTNAMPSGSSAFKTIVDPHSQLASTVIAHKDYDKMQYIMNFRRLVDTSTLTQYFGEDKPGELLNMYKWQLLENKAERIRELRLQAHHTGTSRTTANASMLQVRSLKDSRSGVYGQVWYALDYEPIKWKMFLFWFQRTTDY